MIRTFSLSFILAAGLLFGLGASFATIPATVTIPVGGVDLVSTTVKPTLGVGGATLTSGQCVYRDASDSNELKATDVTTSAGATCAGILLQDTADGQGAVYLTDGSIITNPTFAVGTWYVCDTSGAIAEYSDLASGEYVTYVGYGNTDNDLVIRIIVTGMTKP